MPAAHPTAGGRVVEGLTADVATLDPILVTDVPSGRVTGLLYEEIEMRIARDANGDRRSATERLAWIVAFYRNRGATWYLEQLRERAALWRAGR